MYMKLTPKQKAFCDCDLQSENATEAAMRDRKTGKDVENSIPRVY